MLAEASSPVDDVESVETNTDVSDSYHGKQKRGEEVQRRRTRQTCQYADALTKPADAAMMAGAKAIMASMVPMPPSFKLYGKIGKT